jgi:hypothetical protein
MKTKLTTILLLTAINGERDLTISVPMYHDTDTKVDALIKDTPKWQKILDDHVPGWLVTEVKRKPLIFVFGSNLQGIHGAGAALFAKNERGAVMNEEEGLFGQSYALPTCGLWDGRRFPALPIGVVQRNVEEFLYLATRRGDLHFQVTRVGCGLAGLRDEDVAPMFQHASRNCLFDTAWQQWLTNHEFWGTF